MREAEALLRAGRFPELAALDSDTPMRCLGRLMLGHLDEAEATARQHLNSAGAQPDSLSGWLGILTRVALRRSQNRAAEALAHRMVALAPPNPRLRCIGLILLGRAVSQTGDFASAQVHRDRALRVALEQDDPWVIAVTHYLAATPLAYADPDRSRLYLEVALEQLASIPYWAARCQLLTPMLERQAPEDALVVYRDLIDRFEQFGDRFRVALLHIGCARQCRLLGRSAEALAHSAQAERIGTPTQIPLALYGQAEAQRMLGHPDSADLLYRRVLQIDSLTPSNQRMLALPGLGVAARQGDLPGWDQRFLWTARHRSTEPEAIWEAYEECRRADLGHDRLGRLAALAWESSPEATRTVRLPDLRSHLPGGLPCGDLQLHKPIGSGAMATVWEARDPARPALRFAVKFLDARQAASARGLDRFEREIRALAALRHPGILPVFDRGVTGSALAAMTKGQIPEGTPWMSMPLAEGGALTPWCGRLPWADAKRLLSRLLNALAAAHAQGVLHLDIKPDNVLLAVSGDTRSPRLADFGLARATWESHPARVAGTPRYMAPEQFRADWRSWGPPTDLYAIGCLATELLCGRTPFWGDLERLKEHHLHQTPPALEPAVAVPSGFQQWVDQLLQKDPRDRFASAAEADHALSHLDDSDEITATAAPLSALGSPSTPTFDLDAPLLFSPQPPAAVRHRTRYQPAIPERWTPSPVTAPPSHSLAIARHQVELIGREPEKELLWSALRTAESGQPQALIIEASPGLGAARIGRWLGYQLRLADLGDVVQTSFAELPSAHHGLEGMVRSHSRSQDLHGARLEDWLRRTPWRPDSLEPSDLARALQADEDPLRALPWLTALATRPVLVQLDAVEWSGEALSLVDQALHTHFPLLFVITVDPAVLSQRPIESAWLQRIEEAGGTTHRLAPLDMREGAQLVESILPLIPSQREALVELCRGIPKQIVGALEDWSRRGVFIPTENRFRVPQVELDTLRTTGGEVQVSLSSDLPNSAVLLAVFGGRATVGELEAAAQSARIRPDIEALLSTGSVHREAEQLVLDEALIPPLLSQRTDPRERSAMHRAAACALQSSTELRAIVRRARHLLAGGLPEDAANAFLEAASASPTHAALPLYQEWERALHAAGVSAEDPRWLDGWSILVSGECVVPSFDARVHTRAQKLAQRGNAQQRAKAHLYLSIASGTEHDPVEADGLWRELATDPSLDSDTRALAALQLAFVHIHNASFSAGERWIELSESLVPEGHVLRGAALQLRGKLAHQSGDLDQARTYLEAALQTPNRSGNFGHVEIVTWDALGDVCRDQDDLDAAERCYRRALGLSRSLGSSNQFLDELNLILLALRGGRLHEYLGRLEGLTEDIRTHLRPAYAVFGELVCLTLPRWTDQVDPELSRITAVLDELGFTDVELVIVSEMIAKHLDQTGRGEDASSVRRFAAEQQDRLDSQNRPS